MAVTILDENISEEVAADRQDDPVGLLLAVLTGQSNVTKCVVYF